MDGGWGDCREATRVSFVLLMFVLDVVLSLTFTSPFILIGLGFELLELFSRGDVAKLATQQSMHPSEQPLLW